MKLVISDMPTCCVSFCWSQECPRPSDQKHAHTHIHTLSTQLAANRSFSEVDEGKIFRIPLIPSHTHFYYFLLFFFPFLSVIHAYKGVNTYKNIRFPLHPTQGFMDFWHPRKGLYKGSSLTLIKGPVSAACGFTANAPWPGWYQLGKEVDEVVPWHEHHVGLVQQPKQLSSNISVLAAPVTGQLVLNVFDWFWGPMALIAG